jgi:hypothetical protein
MSEEGMAADSLLRENAELRAEIRRRAEIDAEDMRRIQERYDHLYRQFEALQKWVARGMALQPPPPIMMQGDDAALLDSVMRAGDLEHARMAALIEACEALAAFIESYGPDTALARMHPGFYNIFRAYGKNARAAVGAVRRQADALLSELAAARQLQDWTRKWQSGEHIISTQMMRAMEAMDEARKARAE